MIISKLYDTYFVKLKENNITILLVSNKEFSKSSCVVGVKAGYFQDSFDGTAHFLEHLLFMGSKKYPNQNAYHDYVIQHGGEDNAFTTHDMTCYYISLDSQFLEKGVDMLSWFFREPLLSDEHIDSEKNIINSEHEKNIASDYWIVEDLLKKFIKNKKFNKFGTGNLTSLKGITRKDFMDFYEKYYTTDNMYVCITDNISIIEMQNKYLKYFSEIPARLYKDGVEPRHMKENIKFIKNKNIIQFKSTSDYKILNIYLTIKCNSDNIEEYNLLSFILFLLGTEYETSLIYELKEKELISDINISGDFLLDKEAVITIGIYCKSFDKIDQIINLIFSYLNCLLNTEEKIFKEIYKYYQQIKYKLNHNLPILKDSTTIATEIVMNMIKTTKEYYITREYYVPDYKKEYFTKIIDMLKSTQINIITNAELFKEKYKTSKHYETKYIISKYDIKFEYKQLFDIEKIISVKDFKVPEKRIIKIKKHHNPMPKIIGKKQNIFYLQHPKHDDFTSKLYIIEHNPYLFTAKSQLIGSLYIELCKNIINYFLETNKMLRMSFNISILNGFIIYEYSGLQNQLIEFIETINKNIKYLLEKKFTTIKEITIEALQNAKYMMPFMLCNTYFNILVSKEYTISDSIKELQKLTWDDFNKELEKILKYDKKYYLLVGDFTEAIDKICKKNSEECSIENMLELIDLGHTKEEIKNIKIKDIKLKYTITKKELGETKEMNNCLYRNFIMKKQIVTPIMQVTDNLEKYKDLFEMIKESLIIDIMRSYIQPKLFEELRTIQKLGYIVRSTSKASRYENHVVHTLGYLIQSKEPIAKIDNAIKSFNKSLISEIKEDDSKFREIFGNAKNGILKDLEKDPQNFYEECGILKEIITSYCFDFDIKTKYIEILKLITFDMVKKEILQLPKLEYQDIKYEIV